MLIRILLYAMMAIQMAAWAWIQSRGGKLSDRPYLVFCPGILHDDDGRSSWRQCGVYP